MIAHFCLTPRYRRREDSYGALIGAESDRIGRADSIVQGGFAQGMISQILNSMIF